MKDNNVTPIRDANGRFPKGVSGNPDGSNQKQRIMKTFTREQRAMLQSMFTSMVPMARKRLKDLMAKESISDENLLRAIQLVFQYGMGKPPQSVEIRETVEDELDLASIDPATRKAMIARLRAQEKADDE